MIVLHVLLGEMCYDLLVDQRSLDEFMDTLEAGLGSFIKISGKSNDTLRTPAHFGFRIEEISSYRWSVVK